jgi:hypothetical protein
MGSGVFADPRYATLAARAAAELGGGADLARAILAQFACEKANGWPPQDNNPGNVHVAAMASIGVTGLASGVGDSGACAAFSTPEAGTDAMVALLTRASRYTAAVAAARHNDGAGYLRGVTSAGWGTSYSCAAGYYGAGVAAAATSTPGVAPGTTPPSSSPPPSSGATPGASAAPVTLTADQWNAIIAGLTPGTRYISATNAAQIVALAKAQGLDLSGLDMTQFYGKSVSTLRDYLAAKGSIPAAVLVPGLDIGAAIAGLPAALGGALGSLLVNGAVLVVVLLLAYKGVQGLVEA